MMEEDLIAHMLADAGLAGVALHWNKRPQGGPLPAIVLRVVSGVPNYHTAGPSGLVETRLQLDCYAAGYLAAKTAARSAVASITGKRFAQGNTKFSGGFINGERDDFSAPTGGAEKTDRVMLDINLWHGAAS